MSMNDMATIVHEQSDMVSDLSLSNYWIEKYVRNISNPDVIPA